MLRTAEKVAIFRRSKTSKDRIYCATEVWSMQERTVSITAPNKVELRRRLPEMPETADF